MRSCQSSRNSASGCGISLLGEEQVERRLGALEQTDVQVDAQHRQRLAGGVAQHGADRADLLPVPVELLVGTDVALVAIAFEHVFQRRVVADLALGQVVGDVVDPLAAQVVQDHFGVGKNRVAMPSAIAR